jgi:hypothetical protein
LQQSGLFSAIVTAFLIESQKDLRPDPAQENVQLLRQIAAQSAGKNWVVEAEPGIDHISICVNVFWFLSLVLSLTTALVGIVSLQWIRSHMRSLSDGVDSLGLSHMHSLGLSQSHIPHVFTSLPILLIFSLTFFLIGMIVFLFKLSWPVAIPVSFAIACTFAFLVITTALPALQSFPVKRPSDNPDCFPAPYRSPQSLLFLRRHDWGSRSEIWLRQRTKDFFDKKEVLSHLEPVPGPEKQIPFEYDAIQALFSVKKSRSAESEKERTSLAKCLAEVLPLHLGLFPNWKDDLVDLIPFLPPSKYVPSALFLQQDSATREHLNAVALLQIATCKGQPFQRTPLVAACVLTTRWLFERPHTLDSVPDKQPLHLISKPGTSRHLQLQHFKCSLDLEKVSPDTLEVLIDSLTRFFGFAADFQPEDRILRKTTHTSSYTYWFLNLSANILTKCSLSEELRARHEYILHIISFHLDKPNPNEYLFYTALIYASKISTSPAMNSSDFCGAFLSSVNCCRGYFPRDKPSALCKALKADEVIRGNIDRTLKAHGRSDAVVMSDSHGANDTMAEHRPLSPVHGQDSTLSERTESGGRSSDVG